MKKSIIILGSIAVVLLMISTVTAIPQVQSEPLMKNVKSAEKFQTVSENIKNVFSNLKQIKDRDLTLLDKIIAVVASFLFGYILGWMLRLTGPGIIGPIVTWIVYIGDALHYGTALQLTLFCIVYLFFFPTIYGALYAGDTIAELFP